MDTTDYPSLSRLASLNDQLAAHCLRVETIVTTQLDCVERLFRAATNHDWEAVERASREVARQAEAEKNLTIVRSARAVCDLLRRDPSGKKAAGRLSELLTACRTAKTGTR